MNRRNFVKQGIGTAAAFSMAGLNKVFSAPQSGAPPAGKKFKLKYAPSIGEFRAHAGDDPIAHIRFAADEGFGAMFDNGIMNRPVPEQEAIAKEIEKRGMTLGPFVLYADFKVKSFVSRDQEVRDMLLEKMKQGVATKKRTNIKWALVVPGRYDESLAWDYQTSNVVENLRFCMDVVAPAGLVLVLEPLNPINHPGLFLTKIPQTYQIVKAVNNPCCKILNDMYHQQITEGNLIPNIDMAWDEIAAYHIGDNPGRKEPTTGEINYKNIFKHLYEKGYKGVLCMEHGHSKPGKEGERAVIDAYRACDSF
ncbi:MAG: TIM barrel protein [Candidatus Aminicenantes bacterium]|nr:TIM barrel protein [Candidatus Aminicenantes bacterium]